MKEMVLKVCDTESDPSITAKGVLQEYEQLYTATPQQDAIQLGDTHQPAVHGLSYRRVEEAETTSLGMFRNSEAVTKYRHRTLLLRTAHESYRAYRACRTGMNGIEGTNLIAADSRAAAHSHIVMRTGHATKAIVGGAVGTFAAKKLRLDALGDKIEQQLVVTRIPIWNS